MTKTDKDGKQAVYMKIPKEANEKWKRLAHGKRKDKTNFLLDWLEEL